MQKRTEEFWTEYEEFKDSGQLKKALAWIENLITDTGESPGHFRKMEESGAQGFFLAPFSEISLKDYAFILEHWKEVILKEGYVLQRYMIRPEKDHIYLKPKPELQEKSGLHVLQQKFGNISLERLKTMPSPGLRLVCTHYSGFTYSKPFPLEFLMDKLLKP